MQGCLPGLKASRPINDPGPCAAGCIAVTMTATSKPGQPYRIHWLLISTAMPTHLLQQCAPSCLLTTGHHNRPHHTHSRQGATGAQYHTLLACGCDHHCQGLRVRQSHHQPALDFSLARSLRTSACSVPGCTQQCQCEPGTHRTTPFCNVATHDFQLIKQTRQSAGSPAYRGTA